MFIQEPVRTKLAAEIHLPPSMIANDLCSSQYWQPLASEAGDYIVPGADLLLTSSVRPGTSDNPGPRASTHTHTCGTRLVGTRLS